ncbi:hypothetical protein H0H93_011377 [Arthromyces matolae]|nr:hypothetical protein H0H93_011377 [Arthromyces matolae]
MPSDENRYTTQALRLFLLAPRIRKVTSPLFYELYRTIVHILNKLWDLPTRDSQTYRIMSIGSAFHDLTEQFGLQSLDISLPAWYLATFSSFYDLPTLNWLLSSMTFDKYCEAEVVALHLNSKAPMDEFFRYFAIHGRLLPSSHIMSVELIEPNSWADLMPNVDIHSVYYPNLMLRRRYQTPPSTP